MDGPDHGLTPDEELAEFRAYVVTHDPAIRERLVLEHLEMARHLARRFSRRGEPLDDLEQVASVGLLKAIEGFDPDLGFTFPAYATRTVLGELKRHFRDRGWSIRAPRRVQELYLRLGPAVEDLTQQLGRSPTAPEIAQAMDASEEDVLEALEAGRWYRSASLDAPDPDGGGPQSRLGEEDPALDNAEARSILLPALSTLDERERLILQLRFIDDLTQDEIAEQVGISQMHVSRLLAKSLRLLRTAYGTDEQGGGAQR